MSAIQRNFNNYYLGDNVYELAGELIPDIAELLEVDLGVSPNSTSLSELVGKLGKNEVLRNNATVEAIAPEHMADLLEQSGVQLSLDRSLRSPEITAANRHVTVAVLSGGVANWQDRSAAAIPSQFAGEVFLPTGNRLMNSPTEVTNPNVHYIETTFGRLPTESEYAASIILPSLVSRGRLNVFMEFYASKSGADIAHQFFAENPGLLDENILFVRVANAGIQLAVEMRKAARELKPSFDEDLNNPQVFIATDSFPIARSAEENADPQHFQKAQTGLRQVAVTAKSLYEATL
jgi:hypothetical protein